MSKVIFHGETQLSNWGESAAQGAWIKLWVHPDDLEAFKVLKLRTAKEPGARLATVFALIGPDEVVVDHQDKPAATPAPSTAPPARAKPHPRMGDLGRCAVLWCKRQDFWAWASHGLEQVESEAQAKQFILDAAGVVAKYGGQGASRKHLDSDPECGRAFLDRVFYPFTTYCRENGINLGAPQ